MRSSKDGSTGRTPSPDNAFLPDFLARLGERDEPALSAEADVAGPWRVEKVTTYRVVRLGERVHPEGRPTAAFGDRFHALLTAAVLPGTGRDPLFHLQKDPGPDGYALYAGPELLGHLAVFDEKLVDALHVVACLLRSPESLATLLEAAGSVVLQRVGAILEGRVGLGGGFGEE
jgi:hypothetical protein